jgi:hypothetical protein
VNAGWDNPHAIFQGASVAVEAACFNIILHTFSNNHRYHILAAAQPAEITTPMFWHIMWSAQKRESVICQPTAEQRRF